MALEIGVTWLFVVFQGLVALFIANRVKRRSAASFGQAALIAGSSVFFGSHLMIAWGLFLSLPIWSTQLVLVVCALAAGGLGFRQLRVDLGFRHVFASKRFWGFLGILIVPHALAVTIKAESSVDGLLYHGPVLANMLQRGSLWAWSEPNGYIYYTDLSMVQAAIQARLTPFPIFEDGAQIGYFALLILAILATVRLFTGLKPIHYIAIALMLTAPVIWLQPRMLYVDVAFGASIVVFVVLTIAQIVRPTGSKWEIVALGMSLGSVMAVKPVGLVASTVLAFSYLFLWAVSRRTGFISGPRVKLWRVFAVLTGSLLGLVFYARNWIQFGNPIFPVSLQLLGFSLPGEIVFDSFLEGSLQENYLTRVGAFFSGLSDGALFGPEKADYDPRGGGFGFSVWILLMIAVALLYALSKKGQGRSGVIPHLQQRGIWSAFLIVVSLILVAVQPDSGNSRYVIASFVLISLAGVIWIDLLGQKIQFVASVVFTVLVSVNIFSSEVRFHGGLGSILYVMSVSQPYQPSGPGNPRGVGDEFSWLTQGTSQNIYVESEGGLGPSGMIESTRIMQQSYPLYGHCLCNDVQFSQGRLGNEKLGELLSQARKFDFILLLGDTHETVSKEIESHYKLYVVEPIEGYFPLGYVVLALR